MLMSLLSYVKSRTFGIFMFPLVVLVGLMLWGPAFAQDTIVVTLDQQSVEAVADELSHLVDQQAAVLLAATERDHGDVALDHMITQAINAGSAIPITMVIFLFMIGFAYVGGLRSLHHLRDAVDEWRSFTKDAPIVAAGILIGGGLVAGFTVHGIYSFVAALSTPHG